MEVEARPVRPNFLSVTSALLPLFISSLAIQVAWTLPQIPNEQYQPNIYVPQAPTDFSHPSEAGRDFSPPPNQAPVQEVLNERPEYDQPNEDEFNNERPRGRPYAGSFAEELDGATGEDSEKSIPGSPEQDYPIFEYIPRTSFSCRDKPVPAYYADVEARCQVFHICDVGGHKHSFLCPNGSVFNQKYLVCDWWYDFACENAENLFSKQLVPTETTTQTTNGDVTPAITNTNAAQTFSQDGALIYHHHQTSQIGDYNLNPVFNPGLPQAQLDTPQQVFTNNYYVPQNDIFHGAETGFPGRDLVQANLDNNNNNQQQSKNEAGDRNEGNRSTVPINGNQNSTNNVNLNNDSYNIYNGQINNGNFNAGNLNNGNENNNNTNNQNLNKPGEDVHNVENRNNNHPRSYHLEKQAPKLSHEFSDNKNLNSFQNNREEPTRKLLKGGRRNHDKLTTTQSPLNNFHNRDTQQVIQEQSFSNLAAAKVKGLEQGSRNETAGPQRNENYANNEQQFRTDSNSGYNVNNNFQTNVNGFNTPNPQFPPANTFRDANNFQTNQYTRPDAI